MNKERRNKIAQLGSKLETECDPEAVEKYTDVDWMQFFDRIRDIKSDLEDVRDDEQGAFDNLPESLQGSERGETMQDAIDNMDDAMQELENIQACASDKADERAVPVIDALQIAIDSLQSI